MKRTAESYGYESYDGPLIEDIELYKAKSGEELIQEQIYDFVDRGERHVAIRPEMTPTLARMVSQIHREVSKPIRLFSIPNLMRYEKPQKGRLREHWQFNCDIFGAPKRQGEVEIIDLAVSLLKSFNATSEHFEVLVNDRQVIEALFSKILKQESENSYKLIKIVDRSKKISKELLEKQVLEILSPEKGQIFFSYLDLKSFEELFIFLKKYNEEELIENLKLVIDPLKHLGIDDYIKYDPSIARGLDYYTGLVFEIFDKNPENRRAICGGGAYADLLKIFNEPPLPAVGFGLGDVTLCDFLTTHNLLPTSLANPQTDIFLATDQEDLINPLFSLAKGLREKGIKVVMGLDSLKFNKIFVQAEKAGANFVALLGQKEILNNTVQIKHLKTKIQKEFNLKEIEKISNAIKENQL